MAEFIIGFVITAVSIYIGYMLGSRQAPATIHEVNNKIKSVYSRVVPQKSEVGPIESPTPDQIRLYNNPKLEREQKIMSHTLDDLQVPD